MSEASLSWLKNKFPGIPASCAQVEARLFDLTNGAGRATFTEADVYELEFLFRYWLPHFASCTFNETRYGDADGFDWYTIHSIVNFGFHFADQPIVSVICSATYRTNGVCTAAEDSQNRLWLAYREFRRSLMPPPEPVVPR